MGGFDAEEGAEKVLASSAPEVALLEGGVEGCEFAFWFGHDAEGDGLCDDDEGHTVEMGEEGDVGAEGEEVKEDGAVGRWEVVYESAEAAV